MKAILLVAACTAIRAQTFSGTCRVTTAPGKVKQARFAIRQNQIEPILTFRIPLGAPRNNAARYAFYEYALQVNYLGQNTSFQLSDVTPDASDDESRELLVSARQSFKPHRDIYPTPLDAFNASRRETPLSLSGSTEEFSVTCRGKLH